VLVVDDDRATRRLTKLRLEEEGFEVFEAANGQEALERAVEVGPEVILLDVEMPGMNGIETCRRLRREPSTANIPVLFVTGRHYDDPTLMEALTAGGNDFISKDASTPILITGVLCQQTIFRSQAKLKQMAMTDELTGLFSRRFLFGSLRNVIQAASRIQSTRVACLMADIDHFKRINDERGQHEGDRVLKKIASIISESTREQDLVARFGGEEFVIVITDADAEGAVEVAESIRLAVEKQGGGATISIGVAWMASYTPGQLRGAENLDSAIDVLIRQADEAMCRAKLTGRNRVCVSGDRASIVPATP